MKKHHYWQFCERWNLQWRAVYNRLCSKATLNSFFPAALVSLISVVELEFDFRAKKFISDTHMPEHAHSFFPSGIYMFVRLQSFLLNGKWPKENLSFTKGLFYWHLGKNDIRQYMQP